MALKALSLIPAPTHVQTLDGDLVLSPTTRIYGGGEVSAEVKFLAERLRQVTGFPLECVEERPRVGTSFIELSINRELAGVSDEGYLLEVKANEIHLTGKDAAGVFYAIQTLFQLLPPAVYGRGPRVNVAWVVPHVTIRDTPRFPWRGAMLDCCRHFMPVAFIKKFLDLLALHKLNVFHWHLTEDQGWRIEIKKYPRLTEVGGFRSETIRGHYDAHASGDATPHGGFYSQDEIREIVAYASARHIMIIPEIEVPGHCQAALAAYPEYGPSHVTHDVSTRWGVDPNAIFFPSEATFSFLADVFAEVADLFPGKMIHVGGDEAVQACWENDPAARTIMDQFGLKSGRELQGYFIKRVRSILADLDRTLIGWDEILEGDLKPGAAITVWRGMERVAIAAERGHKVVVCSMEDTYLDFYQSENSEDEPLAGGPVLTLQKVYQFEPIPGDIAPQDVDKILGIQGQLWCEYMPAPSVVEYMAFPRLIAIAETGWSGPEKKNYAQFSERLCRHLRRLDVIDVKYRPLQELDRAVRY